MAPHTSANDPHTPPADSPIDAYAHLINAVRSGGEVDVHALDELQASLREGTGSDEPMPMAAVDLLIACADLAGGDAAFLNTLAIEFERRSDYLAAARTFEAAAKSDPRGRDDQNHNIDAWHVRACDNFLRAGCSLAASLVASRIADSGHRDEAMALLSAALDTPARTA